MSRRTWQRDAVQRALAEYDGFISAQGLHAELEANGVTIGLATVYRSLGRLADDGEADTLQQEGETLYRACETGEHHHHLICRECGTTVELVAHVVETWASRVAAEHGFVRPEHTADVVGTCPRCAAA